MRRYELSDEQWKAVGQLIPPPIGRPCRRQDRLAVDRGYDIPRVRRWLAEHGIKVMIPEKLKPYGRQSGCPRRLGRESYKRRNVVERCVGWLKYAQRIATG